MSFMDQMVKNLVSLAPRLKKRTFDPEAMSIEDISLPLVFIDMDLNEIRSIIEDEVKTYRSLGYLNKTLENLKVLEYHSFEVGIILRYIQANRVLKIHNIDKIIPSFIMGATKKQLHIKVFDIVYRYDNSVLKNRSVDQLQNDIRWTPQEVGYLLRYIDMENRNITNSKR